jgi:hypothetical protein
MVLYTYNHDLSKAKIVVEHCPYFDNYQKYRNAREPGNCFTENFTNYNSNSTDAKDYPKTQAEQNRVRSLIVS